jgi:hypothetical protein
LGRRRFNEIRLFQDLAATGFSVAGGGLGMGVSAYADCGDKYKRSEGGKDVCADGNATVGACSPPRPACVAAPVVMHACAFLVCALAEALIWARVHRTTGTHRLRAAGGTTTSVSAWGVSAPYCLPSAVFCVTAAESLLLRQDLRARSPAPPTRSAPRAGTSNHMQKMLGLLDVA